MLQFVQKKFALLAVCLIVLQTFCAQKANAQCSSIDFSANYTKGCLPVLVTFTASGIPKGSIIYWNFGNGNESGGDTIYHQFTQSGSYDIVLQVTFPDGTTCTNTKKSFLNFQSVGEPDFSVSDTVACSGSTTFTLVDNTKNETNRTWYIDGLDYGSASPMTISFKTAGRKSVTLKAFDANGCYRTLDKRNLINVQNIITPDFSSGLYENAAHDQITAYFHNQTDTGNAVVTYQWDFPGGSPSSYAGKNPPPITYSSLTTPRDVTLTVTTASGCSVKITKSNVIMKYYALLDTAFCLKDSLIYQNKALSSSIQNFFGTILNVRSFTRYGSNYSIKFSTYARSGLIVNYRSNSSQFLDSLYIPNAIAVLPPVADFSSPNQRQCNPPGRIVLHALNGNPYTGTNTYFWQVYDSNNVQVPGSPIGPITNTDTAITVQKDGSYTVTMTVKNSRGCTDVISRKSFIRIATPTADFSIKNPNLCADDTLKVVDLSTPKNDPSNPFQFQWTVQHDDSAKITQNYNVQRPLIFLHTPGVYTITQTVANGTCVSSKQLKSAITVSGVLADFTADNTVGCKPFTAHLSSIIKINLPSDPGNSNLSYFWQVYPAGAATISNPFAANTTITFNKNTCYSIQLTVTSSLSGCKSVITKNNYICTGTLAAFTMDSNTCKYQPVKINNQSLYKPDAYKWSISPYANSIISSDTAKNPLISFKADGCYKVTLTTYRNNNPNCVDTVSHYVCVTTPKAGFFSKDTSKRCAPIYATFTNTSTGAVSYFWDFGDGDTISTTSNSLTHVYFTNNPLGFDVKLAAKNKNGCIDTIVRKNYMKVYGPVPRFNVSQSHACGTITVKFKDSSYNVKKYFVSYGDQSHPDSNKFVTHVYNFLDYNFDSAVYYPTMYAVDDSNCLSSYQKTIVVYRPPVVKFQPDNYFGCQPMTVNFIDSTLYASSYTWDFGDGTTGTGFSPSHVYKIPGIYYVKLTAISPKGCITTKSLTQPIVVYKAPTGTISNNTNGKTICYETTVNFTGQASTADGTPIVSYKWFFGDSNIPGDTSNDQNPSYHYVSSGHHVVALVVENARGCRDTIVDSVGVTNFDSAKPLTPEIYYVTVNRSNQVKVVYRSSHTASKRFGHYDLYRNGTSNADIIHSGTQRGDTSFIDAPPAVDVKTHSNCYTTDEADNCGHTSPLSRTHCTINLHVQQSGINTNRVVWTPYVGWDTVASYVLYRRMGLTGTYDTIATLRNDSFNAPSDSIVYLDTNLCHNKYYYYVSAWNTNQVFHSESNQDSATPAYILQNQPLHLIRTTVLGNSINTNWRKGIQPNIKQYVIDRNVSNNHTFESTGWVHNYATATDTSYTDYNVDVDNFSYAYRVRVEDKCGDVSPVSNSGVSMVITSSVLDDKRLLSWTKYKHWDEGISAYVLQLRGNNGQFRNVAVVTPTDTTYMDDSTHQDIDTSTCYRVLAIDVSPTIAGTDTSVSNVTCPVLPSRIFIPNAFSPNGDDVNDQFSVSTLSIFTNTQLKDLQFDLRVFNRWGQLIWETTDANKSWDGKFDGQFVESGIYVYTLYAHGFDNRRFSYKGTIMLIR
jgi:gliding motility-associated-like protein